MSRFYRSNFYVWQMGSAIKTRLNASLKPRKHETWLEEKASHRASSKGNTKLQTWLAWFQSSSERAPTKFPQPQESRWLRRKAYICTNPLTWCSYLRVQRELFQLFALASKIKVLLYVNWLYRTFVLQV